MGMKRLSAVAARRMQQKIRCGPAGRFVISSARVYNCRPPMEARHHLLENPAETKLLPHMPQLDGIRAVAVLMVMWHHFQPKYLSTSVGAPWGAVGVGLFFTLSGFLITRILLRCKLKIAAGEAGMGGMLRQFYVRRCLRIFPLYYATLLFLVLFNVTGIRERVWWHVAYLSNYLFSYRITKFGPVERHFWSLAVEEQFYLIWPLVIFLTPRKLLLPVILLTIACAPYWSTATYAKGQFGHEWMMPACLGLLGSGALLALFSLPEFRFHKWWNTLIETAGVIGVPLFFIYVTSKSVSVKIPATQPATGITWHTTSFFGLIGDTPAQRTGWIDLGFDWIGGAHYPVTAVFAVFVIGMAARGFRGPLGWLLRSPPLVYVGRISYGVYVVHMLMPHAAVHFFPKWAAEKGWEQLFAYVAASLLVATVSWYALEAPINRLKKYFEYEKADKPEPRGLEAVASVSPPSGGG
jgi:peptidoglycan/LPS O-acetylase OafA/YrhL